MKNIFKFLGIAVLACGMMVACGDKTNEEDNNNNNNNEQPQQTTPCFKVTFDGTEWDASVVKLTDQLYANYGLYVTRAFRTEGSFPYLEMYTTGNAGDYTLTPDIRTAYEGTDSAYTYLYGLGTEDLYSIGYGEAQQVGSNYQCDWQALNGTVKISTFDFNNMKCSYTMDLTMYDYASWAYGMVNDVEDAATKSLKVNAYNFDCAAW